MRWPDKETITGRSQGNRLGKRQEIAYRATDYDWRKVEARLSAADEQGAKAGRTCRFCIKVPELVDRTGRDVLSERHYRKE